MSSSRWPIVLIATTNPGKIGEIRLALEGVPPEQAGGLAFVGAFTEGATAAFLVGAVLIAIGSLAVWLFLNVKHEELATDGPEGTPVHVG